MSATDGGPWVDWEVAWSEALYGREGFYRTGGGPAAHFATATQGPTGRPLARALLRLATLQGCRSVVDLGAGGGELLGHLRALEPAVPLTGVDVVDRPPGLPPDVTWVVSPGGGLTPDDLPLHDALVVAHEWLDVVPCPVAQSDGAGTLRRVLVDPSTGVEWLGPALAGPDLEWCRRHWPPGAADPPSGPDRQRPAPASEVRHPGAWSPGDRVEVGRSRDLAWQRLLDRMSGGLALAVDYGHVVQSRPPAGTLTGFQDGLERPPVPDGRCDVTAHVAVDSLVHDQLLLQREALLGLGVTGRTPDAATARTDPAGYLQQLAEASAEARLLDPSGYGSFWWVLARPKAG